MWNRELTQKLIEKYESFPYLWDVCSPDYKNRFKKQCAMRNIATELNIKEKEIKIKIHNLRTQFMQEVRRVKQKRCEEGADNSYTSKWEFFDSLKFIIREKKQTKHVENLVRTNPNEPEIQTIEECPSRSKEPKKKKRKSPDAQITNDDIVVNKAMSFMNKLTDDYQVFGDYVASEFRLLKSNKNRMLLRRKIQKAIMEVSEIDSLEDLSNSSWSELSYRHVR